MAYTLLNLVTGGLRSILRDNGDVAKWSRPAAHNGVTGGSNPSIPTIIAVVALSVSAAEAKPKQVSASWYESGKVTASGQKYYPDGFSAAHPNLPFGTVLRVTNPKNGRVITVIVNDRGPFVRGRELDLSRGSAIALGFFHSGTAKLLIENLGKMKRFDK